MGPYHALPVINGVVTPIGLFHPTYRGGLPMLLIVTPLITGFSGAHLVGSKNATFSFQGFPLLLRPDAFVAEASCLIMGITEYFMPPLIKKKSCKCFCPKCNRKKLTTKIARNIEGNYIHYRTTCSKDNQIADTVQVPTKTPQNLSTYHL